MKNILIKFINSKQNCSHKNALLNSDYGYCPDCGQFLVKNYYIIRCSCCDIKREAKLSWGEIVPVERFCSNCGSKEYYIEKLDSLNLIDAQFAIYVKEIASEFQTLHPEAQIWVEENEKIKQITSKG